MFGFARCKDRRALASLLGALLWTAHSASAQLPCLPPLCGGDNTPPTVSITAPQSGATVAGTVIVTATASDNRGVEGVEFFLDGNFGGDDTSAPYSVPWNTTAVSNGSHTLTAVARDAAGNRTTSNPVTVTVSNGSEPPPGPVTRFEESHPAVAYNYGWIARNADDWSAWSGGSAVQSSLPGARATFSFSGDSVTWIGYRSVDSGKARVFLDGVFVTELDLFARNDESSVRVYSLRRLVAGSHTLMIEVSGAKNPDSQGFVVLVDAFDVPAPVVSHRQNTDPDLAFAGNWTHASDDPSHPWSGRSISYSNAAGASVTLPFNGTAIGWVGYRGPEGGIAQLFVDGAPAGQVDTYYHSPRFQATLFTASGLANGDHSLTIRATGAKNSQATDALVMVDALDVTTPGTRFEEEDPAIVYSGDWIHGNLNRTWSEGTISESSEPGARATLTFTGTSVAWIGCGKITTGIARVYVDGVFAQEIDTFAPPPIEGYQRTFFKRTGLSPGTHTLTLEATGRKNPQAAYSYIVLDAFDVQ